MQHHRVPALSFATLLPAWPAAAVDDTMPVEDPVETGATLIAFPARAPVGDR